MSDEKNIKDSAVENMTVSSETLANILNLSTRRIRQLADEGLFQKINRGKYKLVDNIQNYITYIKTNNEAKDQSSDSELDLDIEKALHERIKREQDELKLAAMKGDMHKSSDVKRVMNEMLSNFKSKLLALPAKVAPVLVARDNIAEIQNLIQKEVHEALQELSEYNPSEFYSEEYIDLDDDVGSGEGDDVEETEDKE